MIKVYLIPKFTCQFITDIFNTTIQKMTELKGDPMIPGNYIDHPTDIRSSKELTSATDSKQFLLKE